MVENLPRKRFRRKDILFALLLTLFFWGGLVSVGEPAEKYPDRPINMVVPWGQGGAGDLGSKAVAEEKRLDGLADVPTFIECGYPIVISPRYSFCFPKGTPKEIVATFSQAQDKAFKKYAKEIKDGLRRVEIWADFLSYEDTVQYYKKQYEFLYKLSEELGFLAK